MNQRLGSVPLHGHGRARKAGGFALAALLIACSPAPSTSPTQLAALPLAGDERGLLVIQAG